MARTATSPGPAAAPPANGGRTLAQGAQLGGYRLLAPIASGGMAVVWAAAKSGDYGFERLFAIKVMREEIAGDPSFRRMFLEEAKLAARIRHTHVVEVIELGEDDGLVYQVMPLIDGASLSALVKASPAVPRSVAVRVMVDVLRGLHAAHEMTGEGGKPLGIVHRDVSPQNVLVGVDGVAKIADFGVAKAMGTLAEETEPGAPKGKLSYMSPEQLKRAAVDRRSDVFSAGVMLWELLAGARLVPLAATTALAGESIADPRAVDATIPASLAAVAMKALAAEPGARFASTDAMADALETAGRAASLALSAKEIASWTQPLVNERLAARRGEVAEAMTTVLATTASVTARDAAAPRRRPSYLALAAAGAAIAVAAVIVAFARSGAPVAVLAAPSVSVAAPLAVVSSAPSASAPVIDLDGVPAASAHTRAPSRKPRELKPAAPQPKFGNPYGQ